MKDVSVVLTGPRKHFEADTDAAILITMDRADDKTQSRVLMEGSVNAYIMVNHLANCIFDLLESVDESSPEFHQAIVELRNKDANAPGHIWDVFLYQFITKLEEHGYE